MNEETYSGAWTQVERWNYTYNIRNELTQVEKRTGTGTGTYAGKEVYEYCLSCDGAMSVWKTYGVGSAAYPTSWRQYEYDGLNVLRVDEKYDTAGGTLDTNDPWRTIEVNIHKPGSLGALIGKRFYVHTNNDATPDQTNDYTYTYDALGNVQVVYKASGTVGQEAYFFTQDAFGNELSGNANIPASNRTNLLGGATWASARTAGITEHQTGKIQSAFSGLYYFHTRWYDPVVGRFVGRDAKPTLNHRYTFCDSLPTDRADPTGKTIELCKESATSSGSSCLRHHSVCISNDSLSTGDLKWHCYEFSPGPGGWMFDLRWRIKCFGISLIDKGAIDGPFDKSDGMDCEPYGYDGEFDENCIRKEWEAMKKNPPQYNLCCNNCQDVARQIVQRCRILPKVPVPNPGLPPYCGGPWCAGPIIGDPNW